MSTIPNPSVAHADNVQALRYYTSVTVTFFAASAAPTPLYRLYQLAWHFTPATLTIVFGVYALGLMLALLFAGSLSDHIGRRPVVAGALLLECLSLLSFIESHDVWLLMASRALQGIATGVGASALGAAILDADRHVLVKFEGLRATASGYGVALLLLALLTGMRNLRRNA